MTTRSVTVLVVGDVLGPFGLGAVDWRLPHREVRHEVVGCGAMPVPLAGRRMDRVAGANLDHLPAARLHAPHPLGDVERLADGMGMPRVARAGREADEADTHAGRRLAAGDGVDPDVAVESIRRTLRGRLLRLDLHRSSLRRTDEGHPISPL